MPFGEEIGDHRALFIDVTVASTLGVDLPPLQSVKARILKLGDPRVVTAYNTWLRKDVKRFSILDQVLLLSNRTEGPPSKAEVEEYVRLDKIRIMGMNYAEKRCRQLRMGGIPWTPELSKIRVRIEVWQLILKRLRGGK